MSLIIPKKLSKGSKIATVSPSWGGPGAIRYRYDIGKKQLQDAFGVNVIEMPNTLKAPEFLYNNPKERAKDLMQAFEDNTIEGIFATIGGNESIRLLPYINYDIIKNNPKIFMGYSDSTIFHFICYKAGLRTYYGPTIMSGFAENQGLFDYMKDSVYKTLFSDEIIGEIKQNTDGWTNEFLDWFNPEHQKIKRKLNDNNGWRFLQGSGIVEGNLLGGCVDSFPFMWGTEIWPNKEEWKGKILFMEPSEEQISNESFERIMRTLGAQGVLGSINGIILGRAQDDKNYDDSLLKIVNIEFGVTDLPIITGMDFGHTDPIFVIPIGAKMRLDMDNKKVFIDESGVK